MLFEKPISLLLAAVTILFVTSYVDAEHFYPKCFMPSGAIRNPKARGKCAFHCPLNKKHTVCGTDGKHYRNECFLCRNACLKVTLSKACDGPCPCKHHQAHNGRHAVHHNAHHQKHLKHVQAHHSHYVNGKKYKMRRKVYKVRKGKKHIRKEHVHANGTMRNHHSKQGHGNHHDHMKLMKHGVKHKNGHSRIIHAKVRNMHKRMNGHNIIVKKSGNEGKHVYTRHRDNQKHVKNDKPSWLNSFDAAIKQWAYRDNGHRNHNAVAKITNTRYSNGRPGKRTVYTMSKKGRSKKHHKTYKKSTKKPRRKRYGFFKKRMLRSKRKRKRKVHKQ